MDNEELITELDFELNEINNSANDDITKYGVITAKIGFYYGWSGALGWEETDKSEQFTKKWGKVTQQLLENIYS